MYMNKIEEIQKQYEESSSIDIKNDIFKGIVIVGKYTTDENELEISPAHDEIFIGFDGMEEAMSEADIVAMFALNWGYDDDSWHKFV